MASRYMIVNNNIVKKIVFFYYVLSVISYYDDNYIKQDVYTNTNYDDQSIVISIYI